jgi:hypothetical protein
MNFRFSPEQREAVNRELVRRGLDPIEAWDEEAEVPNAEGPDADGRDVRLPDVEFSSSPDGELAERQRKFGMMMKPFQL